MSFKTIDKIIQLNLDELYSKHCEINDSLSRSNIVKVITDYFNYLFSTNAHWKVYGKFKVTCDETNNPEVLTQNNIPPIVSVLYCVPYNTKYTEYVPKKV